MYYFECPPPELAMGDRTMLSKYILPILILLLASAANATAPQRTFVASTGSDANPCSITLPCRGFAAAVALVADGGEVIALDSAGYGPVTITKSVSIIAPSGVYAGITVPLGASGILIDSSGVTVTLRGLTVTSVSGGNEGIIFAQGAKLTVEDCEISNMSNTGVAASATGGVLVVRHSVLRGNGTGIDVRTTATLDGVHIEGGDKGIFVSDAPNVAIINSVVTSYKMFGVDQFAFSVLTNTTITGSTITGEVPGVRLAANIGQVSYMSIFGNTITGAVFGNAGGIENFFTSVTNFGVNTAGGPPNHTFVPISPY